MRTMLRRSTAVGMTVLLGACASAPSTQSAATMPPLDRTVRPTPGPRPSVDFPEVERFTLSNGLPVWVVEKREVPLVTVQLIFEAGGIADPPGQPGLASLTAAMLTEGTTSRTATQIANQVDLLAADLNTGAGRETGVVSLSTLSRSLEPALDIFADVIVNPAFNQDDWERVQQQRLVSLIQTLDQPSALAGQEFARLVYGDTHPYGRPLQGTPESVTAITPADLRRLHQQYYVPTNGNLIVVGDVDTDRLRDRLERAFSDWERAPAPAGVMPGAVADPPETHIYLIDKPGAAQSEIRIGHPGIARNHPDYFPILVLNGLLGGDFTSRINLNLREDKGYTYGASSSFTMARIAGPFVAGAAVQTAVTRESVIEFMNELEGIRTSNPVTSAELESTKSALIRREPLLLETNSRIAGRIADLVRYDLPADYFDQYTDRIAEVTVDDVNRVAREQLRPGNMAIVVVGDRAAIEQGLRELPYPVDIVAVDEPEAPA